MANMEDNVEETTIGRLRREYQPIIPAVLQDIANVNFSAQEEKTSSVGNSDEIAALFPNTFGRPVLEASPCEPREQPLLRVGVVLSGGQAAGGHNVITGLYDALKAMNPESVLIGFLNGPIGIINTRGSSRRDLSDSSDLPQPNPMYMELTGDIIDRYRNTGGFDMIRSGRDKIEKEAQKQAALEAMKFLELDGLVVIGGDDSNTNAAVLAEYFQAHGSNTRVVGVPKTIDGDLQNEYIEVSFGFDTAVKTYSEMISNIARDSQSAAKAWHFVKLMGRDASHITLDCALQTHPNIALIGEAIGDDNITVLTHDICNVIARRAEAGKNYGVVLIPEGIIGFIPSMKELIADLNMMLQDGSDHLRAIDDMPEISEKLAYVKKQLGSRRTCLANFKALPRDIQAQLILERDPHGNVQLSQVPTESLFIQMVERELKNRKSAGEYVGKFRGLAHFFGYDGRSCFPSNFDSNYCYALGRVGAALIAQNQNGYMARVYNLDKMPQNWQAGAIPITMLMNMEVRHGHPKPVIKKALVDTSGSESASANKYHFFETHKRQWEIQDAYRRVGPIQFFGPPELTDSPPINVLMRKNGNMDWPVGGQENAATSG